MYSMFLGQPHQSIVDWINGHPYNLPTPPTPTTHEETWYKYAGDTEWKTVDIKGGIDGVDDYNPTEQILNVQDIVEIEIGSDVTGIGTAAFSNCSNLVKITIPDSVNYIGDKAFSGCQSLYSEQCGIVFIEMTYEKAKSLMNNPNMVGGTSGFQIKCQCGTHHFYCYWVTNEDGVTELSISDID